jgi:hypothetical protein
VAGQLAEERDLVGSRESDGEHSGGIETELARRDNG